MTLRRALRIWSREYLRASVAVCGEGHRRCIIRQIRGRLARTRSYLKGLRLGVGAIRRLARWDAGVGGAA